jgi:hypothetical protein
MALGRFEAVAYKTRTQLRQHQGIVFILRDLELAERVGFEPARTL